MAVAENNICNDILLQQLQVWLNIMLYGLQTFILYISQLGAIYAAINA